jgi:hypothetical protein
MRTAKRIFVRKPEGKRPLWTPNYRQKGVLMVDLKYTYYELAVL